MPGLFFFCISGVMNISLSCCNMIAWQQALLCNVEHLFGVINKIAVFLSAECLIEILYDIFGHSVYLRPVGHYKTC